MALDPGWCRWRWPFLASAWLNCHKYRGGRKFVSSRGLSYKKIASHESIIMTTSRLVGENWVERETCSKLGSFSAEDAKGLQRSKVRRVIDLLGH